MRAVFITLLSTSKITNDLQHVSKNHRHQYSGAALQCHDHAAYLVDALIDTNPMIKDWRTMADLLLSGEGKFGLFDYRFSKQNLLKQVEQRFLV